MSSNQRILLGTKRFPNNHAPAPKAPEEHWLLAYIKKNPFQSGVSLATLYGVLVIFAYHFHIEYFPSFDLKSLASTVFAAAYTALFFLVVFSLGLFAPAYVIGSWGVEEQDDENANEESSLQREIINAFGVAFFIFFVMCLVFLLVVKYGLTLWFLVVVPVAIMICALGVFWFRRPKGASSEKAVDGGQATPRADAGIAFDKDVPGEAPAATDKSGEQSPGFRSWIVKHRAFVLTMFVVASMELSSMVIVLYMMYDSPEAKATDVTWTVFFSLLGKLVFSGAILHGIGCYLVSAWRNPAMKPSHRGFSLAAALVAPVLVASAIGNFALFFALTAMTTKYGNFRAGEMTLTNVGCRIVESGGETLCVKQSDGTNKVCNVHVMSRIGTETYLLVAYPGKKIVTEAKQKTLRDAAEDAAKKRGEIIDEKQFAPDPNKWVYSVYLPSKEILGSRVDTTVRHFDKASITAALKDTPSACDAVAPAATPAQPAPPAPPKPPKQPDDHTAKLLLAPALFAFDKYDLTAAVTGKLDDFAKGLVAKNAASMTIRVMGHTDSIGLPYHNLQLSQMRAIAVMNYLQPSLTKHIQDLDVAYYGVGPSQPQLADDRCPGRGAEQNRVDCLKPNRRVEVTARWSGEKVEATP